MGNRGLVPALLLYWDASWIMQEETRAVPDSLDEAATAIERLRARKPVLVAREDGGEVLAAVLGRTGEG